MTKFEEKFARMKNFILNLAMIDIPLGDDTLKQNQKMHEYQNSSELCM
jgi:hypothetical protein